MKNKKQTTVIDPILKSIIDHLKKKYRCHTAILYGSRARGVSNSTSDYDVVGICKSGAKTRIAKKQNGYYWDVFVHAEKDLRKLDNQHLGWRDAKVLFERGRYGRNLVRRIQKFVNEPFKPAPQYLIDITKVWSQKQLDRYKAGDVHGLYRRTELQAVAIEHYFEIRRKRFWGPKAGLQWLEVNDPITFKLFERVFRKPTDNRALKSLVARVYKTHG